MYDCILSFITAFLVTFIVIPSVIKIAREKNLVDEPSERRSHSISTPSLGGIAIFAGVIFSIVMWTPFAIFGDLQYILAAFVVIFLLGVKDDIDPTRPLIKLMGQIFAALILVFKANVRITSLYGIFGAYDLPEIASIALSLFTILVIINAFNLIDGINGLSGSIIFLICVTLGSWFLLVGETRLAIVAFSLAGAALAFLRYNVTPAKIFMGDTGSLLGGLVCSILAIEFIEMHQSIPDAKYYFAAAPAVAIGVLILPLFDTLRVFTIRILNGKSPLYPDRNHIHHLLIDSGLSHSQATFLLVCVNILFMVIVVKFQGIGNAYLVLLIFGIAIILTFILTRVAKRKRRIKQAKG